MQVGLITIDGRQIGVVTQAEDHPDTTAPLLSSGDSPLAMPHDPKIGGAYGGPEHYSAAPHESGRPHYRRSRPRHEPEHRRPDHRHGPGHYPRGEEREKEQQKKQEQRRQERPAGNISYSSSGNPFDRARFAKELEEKPWLKEKMAHVALGENQDPNANLAVIETMMNRAVVRGTSLEQQAKRHRSSGKDEGGYYAGWAPHYSDQKKAMFDRNLGEALKGSNITNYATDNSSGDLARREIASGSFKHHKTLNGESFFSPGHAEPVLRDKWQRLNKRAIEAEDKAAHPDPSLEGSITPPSMSLPKAEKHSAADKPFKMASADPMDGAFVEPSEVLEERKFGTDTPPAPVLPEEPTGGFRFTPPTPGDKHDPRKNPNADPSRSIPSDYDIG